MNRAEVREVVKKVLETLQSKQDSLSLFLEGIQDISQRLDRIEKVLNSSFSRDFSEKVHPSQEKFQSLGPLAHQSFRNQRICPFEPSVKQCDECSMCSCRGF